MQHCEDADEREGDAGADAGQAGISPDRALRSARRRAADGVTDQTRGDDGCQQLAP